MMPTVAYCDMENGICVLLFKVCCLLTDTIDCFDSHYFCLGFFVNLLCAVIRSNHYVYGMCFWYFIQSSN